jgi:thiaminase
MKDYTLLRFGWLNTYYGEQVEVSVEEAKELIKNPPKRMSTEYIQDLKTIYGL